MRKIATFALCILLVFVLFGCSSQQEPSTETVGATEPLITIQYNDAGEYIFNEGTTLCGVDISGLSRTEAAKLLRSAVNGYSVDITVNGTTFHFTAEDIGLGFREAKLVDYEVAIKNGKDPSAYLPFVFNEDYVRSTIAKELNVSSQNVSIVYNPETKHFEFVDAVPGMRYDLGSVMQDLTTAVKSLNSECTLTVTGAETAPLVTSESESAIRALEKANEYMKIILVYSYTPDNSTSEYEVVTDDDIGSFITFDSNLNPRIDSSAVLAYAEKMNELYGVGLNDGKFLTSHGYYLDMDIYYADQLVDTKALAADITYCLTNGISGARAASYLPAEKGLPYDLGGQYVEIDLTAQTLWAYNNYECVMYTPIVTGCIRNGWDTPNGVYDVVYKDIHAELMGLYVNYWMPFFGNYGLHDANWRVKFGGEEYLFNGSHGCVNIPPVNAKTVFNNVEWDTPVIVYGGVNEDNPVKNEIYCEDQYVLGINAAPYDLDISIKYGYSGNIYYYIDNTDVVAVTRDGVVTPINPGTAEIKVYTHDWGFCPKVEKVIKIIVTDNCTDYGHVVLNWKVDTAPTCTSEGTQVGKCTVCETSMSSSVPASHKFGNWKVTTDATCTSQGLQERTCSACNHVETQIIEKAQHTVCRWTMAIFPTCSEAGERTGVCRDCETEITETFPAVNHDFVPESEFCGFGCGTENPDYAPTTAEE